jgi:acyl-homoserine-lactone acylase
MTTTNVTEVSKPCRGVPLDKLMQFVALAWLCLPCGLQAQQLAPTQTTIYRDNWGVPHIYAGSEEAGFYALGYAQAQDRLPQLLGGMLWVQGRSAEIMGDAALPGDIEMRRWRTWEEGLAGFRRLSPQLQRDYRQFVAGANRYMAEHPKEVPPWAPEMTPESFVAIARATYFASYNSIDAPQECTKSGAGVQVSMTGEAATGSWPAAARASNEWLVMPSRTAGGNTILLADPHVEVNNPFYYEYTLDTDQFKSAGFAVGPVLWQAQNPHVAWAFTTGNPDLWDCYAVDVDPANPRQFLYDGQLQTMDVHHETFKSSSGKVVERDFEYTHHNGVLSAVVGREGSRAYVVSMSQMHDAGLFDEELYRMNRAGSVADLRAALVTLGMWPQNLMAIDDQGHAYFLRAGKTPRRPAGYDWSGPVPGNTSATAWLGFHPLDEMVQVMNPPQGYMQNNNVAPDRLFAEGNLDLAKYPAYLVYDTPGRITSRGQRALEVLSKASGFTVEQAMALAMDEKWMGFEPWRDALRQAVKRYPQHLARLAPPAQTLVRRILAFDGFAHQDSVAALNFYFWRTETSRLLDSSEQFAGLRSFPWNHAQFSPEFLRGLLDAAEAAANEEIKTVGDMDQPLGKLFRAAHGGPSWPLGGISIHPKSGLDCLRQAAPQCERTMRAFDAPDMSDKKGERVVTRGSQAMRLVVFGRKPETWTLYAFGQQSTVGLPHADDQARLFSSRQFKAMLLDKGELLKNLQSTATLEVPALP